MSWQPEEWPTPKWLEIKQNTRPVVLLYFSFNRCGFEMLLQLVAFSVHDGGLCR
jgi:hypothetical protein